MKVCFYGDSIGRGVVLDNVKKRYGYSENSFARLLEGEGIVTVNNRCKFGCTSTKGLEVMRAEADRMKNYDYIVIMYGGNDSDYDWPAVARDPEHGAQYVKTSVPVYKQNIRDMVDLVHASGSTPVLLSMIPMDPARYFNWITRKSDPDAILKYIKAPSGLYFGNQLYNLALFDVAAELSVPLIDICSPFLRELDFSDYLCEDGIHPSEAGHMLIYEEVKAFLQEHQLLQNEE